VGRLLLISRLALGDIKRRRVQSALVVVMIATTTATLTLGLALHRVTESPFARTRAATRGPDAVIEIGAGQGGGSASPRQFASLIHAPDQKVLLIASWLLAMLAIASIAVVVGGRMAEQTRRVGLLKAIGATPRLIAVVLLAENLPLALAAAAVGLVAGDLITPVLANAGVGLLGTPGTPPLTAASIALMIAAAAAVAAAATSLPAIRGARTSTVRALNDPARAPRRRPGLIEISAGLPVPLLLGLRLIGRRPRRTALTAASLAIAVTMIVAAITLQHNVEVKDQPRSPTAFLVTASIGGRVTHLVFVLSAILMILAAVNAIFTTWATVIDVQRPTALARALGATPQQITAGLTSAQLLPALAAACIGIPAGLALYSLAARGASASPPILSLLAVIPGTLIVVAALTAIPARIGAHRPVAEVLRSE
jgi:putative ABC transport system permease protein